MAIGRLILAGSAVTAYKRPLAPNSVGSDQAARKSAFIVKADKVASQAVAVLKAPESESKDAGCADRKDRRDSDLCAQWKAADAAFDGARAAERQTIIGWVGLFLGFITMGAAIAAAWYARDAANQTRKAVTVAKDSLAHDHIVSQAELRPWLSVDLEISGRHYREGYFTINLRVKIRNYGKMVAQNVGFSLRAQCLNFNGSSFDQMPFFDIAPEASSLFDSLLPNEEMTWETVAGYPQDEWIVTPVFNESCPCIMPTVGVNVHYNWTGESGFHQTSRWFGVNGSIGDMKNMALPIHLLGEPVMELHIGKSTPSRVT